MLRNEIVETDCRYRAIWSLVEELSNILVQNACAPCAPMNCLVHLVHVKLALGLCSLFYFLLGVGYFMWLIFSKICIKQNRKNNFASFRAIECFKKLIFSKICVGILSRSAPPITTNSWWNLKCGKNKIKEAWAPFNMSHL